MSTDLAPWLLDCIADDEAEAPMALGPCDCDVEGFPLQHGIRCIERFMAECDAKRRIVEAHAQVADYFERDTPGALTGCQCCHWDSDCQTVMPNDEPGCYTLSLLALPYADRPGFKEEWKP